MSIESRKHQYGKVFGHWQIKEYLGSGSGGKSAVFRLEHAESPGVESALKVISLIEERGSIDSLSPERREEYIKARKECSERAEGEVRLMNDLQGNTNIVDYLDHTFVDWSDETGFGRDMLIRMERLSDLRAEITKGRIFEKEEVLKIGRDISTALILCHKKGILHRDIKPENIFINKNGNYKLGDFGISRIINTTSSAVASTGIGTPQYWAPEQTSGKYDVRVDIYSLGLVLYELSNRNRLPFAESSYVRDQEIHRRLLGEPLPMPSLADEKLAQVILTACAFRPEDRYQTAEAFLRALNRLDEDGVPADYRTMPAQADASRTGYRTMPAQADTSQTGYRTMPAQGDFQKAYTPPVSDPVSPPAKDWKKFLPWILAILAVILAVFLLLKPDAEEDSEKDTAAESTETTSAESTPADTQIVENAETQEMTVPTDAPTAEPNSLAALVPGDTFTFGRYEQDNNYNNGSEDIEWIVLENQGDRMFVISKYALDCQRYHTQNTNVTWETSSIRNWLNYVFYNDAFTAEEQAIILTSTVTTEDNPVYGTDSGSDTQDKIYLPSLQEVETYCSSTSQRICRATTYAVKQNAYVNSATKGSWWLLRTAGINSANVVSIDSDGSIDYDGGKVAADRGTVRPVMWITLDSGTQSETEPVYLNELGYCAKTGKLWTRSNQPATGNYHTPQDAPACWSDENTPGHTYGTVKDNCGNVYTYGIHVDGTESRTHTLSYDLEGKYTTFSGVCACPSEDSVISSYVYDTSTHYEKYFEIYGDGQLLFRSNTSRYDTLPQSFSIDVTGIKILTIQYPAKDGPNEIATLYDALLS